MCFDEAKKMRTKSNQMEKSYSHFCKSYTHFSRWWYLVMQFYTIERALMKKLCKEIWVFFWPARWSINLFPEILTFKKFQILLPRHQIFIQIGVVCKLMISHCSKWCKTCVESTRSFQNTFKPIPSCRFPDTHTVWCIYFWF